MQHIEKFNKNTQIEVVGAWLKARNEYIPPEHEYPEIGYMIFERGEPVACAFIRKVEGNFAQFDTLVTNPDFPGDIRHSALDVLVAHVMREAKSLGFKTISAYSLDLNTVLRSSKHGFKVMPHALIVADLN